MTHVAYHGTSTTMAHIMVYPMVRPIVHPMGYTKVLISHRASHGVPLGGPWNPQQDGHFMEQPTVEPMRQALQWFKSCRIPWWTPWYVP